MRFAALVILAACAPAPGTGAPPTFASASNAPVPRAATPTPDHSCPLAIAGVSADIEHTGRGATITLTAPPDEMMLLRARAHGVSDADGGLLGACPCAADADAGAPPAMQTTVDDIEGGARITVSARDPDDAKALRTRLRSQLGRVHGGDCRTAAAP